MRYNLFTPNGFPGMSWAISIIKHLSHCFEMAWAHQSSEIENCVSSKKFLNSCVGLVLRTALWWAAQKINFNVFHLNWSFIPWILLNCFYFKQSCNGNLWLTTDNVANERNFLGMFIGEFFFYIYQESTTLQIYMIDLFEYCLTLYTNTSPTYI